MRKEILTSAIAIVVLSVGLGLAYPLVITGAAQVLYPNKADGSTIKRDGQIVGSRLIAQDFKGEPQWFQSRPSATEYSATTTFFNNQGPNQEALRDQIAAAADAYAKREGIPRGEVPVDAVTTSGSGVDPHISERNAEIQARRVARVRGIPLERVETLIDENTDGRFLGVLGEAGVNVVELNLALEEER